MENFKNVAPLSDFDWNAFENGVTESAQSKEELEKAYDKTLGSVNENDVVEGTVIAINKREVVVNIGYKSDGIIPVSEFRYNPELKVGDQVEVYIESQEDKKGQLVLSHKKARASKSWERVNQALENKEVVKHLFLPSQNTLLLLTSYCQSYGRRDREQNQQCELLGDFCPQRAQLVLSGTSWHLGW